MSNVFNNLFKNKEEKRHQADEYSRKIFPKGDEQRKLVSDQISEMFPDEKPEYLMMHYIMIKELIIDNKQIDYETAAEKIEKKKLVRITPDLREGMRTILETDLM